MNCHSCAKRFSLAITLLLALIQSAFSQQRLAIDLAPIRWQLLPEAIQSIVVAPDGRVWYQLEAESVPRSDAELRAHLESEFRQPSPQISGALIALLEPAGRAWFYVKGNREAWGYDGQSWIERQAQPGSVFVGTCPTKGRLCDNVSNRVAGGKIWLRDDQGLHTFDGSKWTYKAICPPLNTVAEIPQFAVSPDGNYAVAITPKTPERASRIREPDLWTQTSDSLEWHKLAVPWPDKNVIWSFSVTDEGLLYCVFQSGWLWRFPIHPPEIVQQLVSDLLPRLTAAEFEAREQAFAQLRGIAPRIKPELLAARERSSERELIQRLDALLSEGTSPSTPATGLARGDGTKIGASLVREARAIHHDEKGNLLLFAQSISQDGKATGGGLATIRGNVITDVRQVPLERSFFAQLARGAVPLLETDDDTMWLSGLFPIEPARSVSFRVGIDREAPDPRFQHVQAVDTQGHAYLARRKGTFSAETKTVTETNARLAVFTPHIVDRRPLLDTRKEVVSRTEFVVASDGAVWASRREGLSRFDGAKWEVIQGSLPGQAGTKEFTFPVLAGRENLVLCQTEREYALFQHNRLVAIAPLRKLIEAYSSLFAAAFPPSFSHPPNPFFCIASDKSGNVWLAQAGKALVFANNSWIELKPTPLGVGSVHYIAAVEDGSKMYLFANRNQFAEIADGEIKLTDAPSTRVMPSIPLMHRGQNNSLWIANDTPRPDGSRRQRVIRVGLQGSLEEIVDQGWPVLADGETLWLAQVKDGTISNQLTIWNHGAVRQQIELPGSDSVYWIGTDKPGSVCVLTTLGLHHYAASSTDPRSPYELKAIYQLPASIAARQDYRTSTSQLVGFVVPLIRVPIALEFIRLPSFQPAN